jgi:transcriptional repressor NrdR
MCDFDWTSYHLMLCPYCTDSDSKVIDSRDAGDGIRRRRECLRCGLRFTTYEYVQSRVMQVVKSDERREEFNREKLWASLTKACAKRPLAIGTIEKVVADIESNLANSGRAEISSRIIGEMVMERLKDLDRVAYIRFASVYRAFRDIESFKEEIEALLEPREPEGVPSNQLSFLEEETVPTPPRRRRARRSKPPQTEQA